MNIEECRPKPPELLSLYDPALNVFKIIKDEFKVPDIYELALHDVDAAEPVFTTTHYIAAITMRKIQAVRWVAKPGVEIANDAVVTLAADLQRSLDHLVEHCSSSKNADALKAFKHQIRRAARCTGRNGDIEILR